MNQHKILISPDGNVKFIYNEKLIDTLNTNANIRSDARASHVEPDEINIGKWKVDLSPVNGPIIHNFNKRSIALQYEVDWLNDNYLIGGIHVTN